MHRTNHPVTARLVGVLLAMCAGLAGFAAAPAPSPAVTQAPAPAPAQGPPRPRFPAQLRAPDDPQVVARGKRVYDISCRACHGADLRGGDMGGPNLLRSDVMLNDVRGENLRPLLQGGRGRMPAVPLDDDDSVAVAVYVHSVLAQGRAQGAPPAAPAAPLDILVGRAADGQLYFTEMCGRCHSVTGDLQGIASRVPDPVELQNRWVAGGRQEPLDRTAPPSRRDVTAVVTPLTGRPIEGRLERIDDFAVTLVLADGAIRTFRRVGAVPRVEIRDPLVAHKQLLQTYSDRDIHNVTAFLVTLK